MLKTTRPSFSANTDTLRFSIPQDWTQLTQQQLRYVCYSMLHFEGRSAKVYILVRMMGIEVIRETDSGWICRTRVSRLGFINFKLHTWQIDYYLHLLDYIDTPSPVPVCLSPLGKWQAVDNMLHGVPFSDYLQMENIFQGYLVRHDDTMLAQLARIMYVNSKNEHPDKMKMKPEELLSVFLWYSSIKMRFAGEFPDFLARVDTSDEEAEQPNMMEVMNSEIRALTEGDITKENIIMNTDCWRALTELNEKAREAKELKEKYGRK